MKPLAAGQAAVARHEGKVWIVICDERENLPIGGVAFEIRGGVHHINFGESTVGVASVILRLTAGDNQRFYTCLYNEVEEGVVESLATQAELPIMFSTPLGECVGSTVLPNGIRGMMQRQWRPTKKRALAERWRRENVDFLFPARYPKDSLLNIGWTVSQPVSSEMPESQ